jgi:hypothetical protein
MRQPTPSPRALAALLTLVAVLPLLVAVPRIAAGLRDACPASDFALMELATDQAAHGAQLVGPYSRFGWRHPGPALFYLLAPFHAISGGSSASLPVGALVINAAALLAMVLALGRWGEDARAPLLALPLGLAYGAYLGPGFLYNIWNPAVTVLPLGALMLLAAAVACGRTGPLPLLALLGSFLVQTHVGYLPVVITVVVTALVLRRWSARPADSAPPGRAWLLAAGVLLVSWAPPLIEQATRTPGNLTLIARFFLGGGASGHGVGEALAIVARELAWPWTTLVLGARDQYAPYPTLGGGLVAITAGWALLQIALLALWSIRLRQRPFACALARVCLACSLVAVPAVMRINGEVRPYLTTWISMVGLLGTVAALGPLLRFSILEKAAVRGHAVRALAGALAIAVALLGRPVVRSGEVPTARSLADTVAGELRRRQARRPQMTIQTRDPVLFYAASAMLLQLHKAGFAFAVDQPWWNFFGERWRPSGAEDEAIDVRASALPDGPAPLVCQPNGAAQICITFTRAAR